MTWKSLLKTHSISKACGCAECKKQQFEKTLVGNQKKIDANKDGKITGEDFAMLRDEENKAQIECPQCKGKGCEHCNYKGYHIKSNPFTDRD